MGVGVGGATEAILARAEGVGMAMRPRVEAGVRGALPAGNSSRELADLLAAQVRQLLGRANVDLRSVLALGLFADDDRWPHLAEWLAERTGVTVATNFAARDIAAGGTGSPIAAAADYLLFRSSAEDRLLIDLGSTATVLAIPREAATTAMVAFDAAPCMSLLDGITWHGSRGKDAGDVGGTRAVQGKCLDALLAKWLAKKWPKPMPANAIDLPAAFEFAREANGTLFDLLCTATHFVAQSLGGQCRPWPFAVYVSGRGTRNGFLWQLLQQQFPQQSLKKLDDLGVSATARGAAGAAVLAALTLDGTTGNCPLLTGASGGRLIGRLVPGDPRNWAQVCAWTAEQLLDYLQLRRAA